MEVNIIFDKETGKILSVITSINAEFNNFSRVEVPDDWNPMRYTYFKVVNHAAVPIGKEERIALYFDGIDPDISNQENIAIEEQAAKLNEMIRRSFLYSLSDKEKNDMPLLFKEYDDSVMYYSGDIIRFNGKLYENLLNGNCLSPEQDGYSWRWLDPEAN